MKKNSIAGFCIFFSLVFALYAYFVNDEFNLFSSLFAWFALILLFNTISKKKLLLSLLTFTFILYSYCLYKDIDVDIIKAISINEHLLSLLIAVGFLKIIASPKKNKIKSLPKGKSSFFKTYLGVHLFGSVINLSALLLVADKLYKKASLTNLQLIVLTRAFSSDAFWSPFFVAFAAALTYAPNLKPTIIFCVGIVVAFCSFLITYFEVMKNKTYEVNEFRGYPIYFDTLYIPFLLAILVLVFNYYFPDIKMIMLISLFSLSLTFFILPIKVGVRKSVQVLLFHITDDLPKMKNELGLFLIAGLFGVIVSSILKGFDFDIPLEHFNGMLATILLAGLILVSFVGIHPIISISVIGSWLVDVNQTLLAMSFLMSWAISVSTSPFSGLNLTIQSRYNIDAWRLFRINIIYALKIYFICAIILCIIDSLL